MPLTGVTLPFVSAGGSSLLMNALVIGMLMNISHRQNVPVQRDA
jgi:cell division protein FtsW (lipid II flippase)